MTMKMKAVAFLSWASFTASFFLPAVRIDVDTLLGWRINLHDTVPGWQAAWGGFANIQSASTDLGAWLWALHGATNVLVVASPVGLMTARRARWHWLAHAMLLATFANASVMIWLKGAQAIGYYLWLASFVGLTFCLYQIHKKEQGGNPTVSANNRLKPTARGRSVAESLRRTRAAA